MENTTYVIAHMLDPVFLGKLFKTKHDRYEMTKTCIQVEHDLDSSAEEIDSPSLLERPPTLDSDEIDFSYQILATLTQDGLSSRPKSKIYKMGMGYIFHPLSGKCIPFQVHQLLLKESFLQLAQLSLGPEPILTAAMYRSLSILPRAILKCKKN